MSKLGSEQGLFIFVIMCAKFDEVNNNTSYEVAKLTVRLQYTQSKVHNTALFFVCCSMK